MADRRIDKIWRRDGTTEKVDVTDLKVFRPATLDLLTAMRQRLDRLPPHALADLLARWKSRDDAIQILNDQSFFMPQTADEEDRLVDELKRQMGEIEEELVKAQYAHSSAHVVALEQQLLAYRTNSSVQARWPDHPGALQAATVQTLKSAQTYCWSPNCVEAVAASAARLTDDAMPADMPLGEVMAPAASGWWWFEKPIPALTTTTGEPIVALLWRRELRTGPVHVVDALGHEAPVQGSEGDVFSLTWFNAFIMESITFNGRKILTPSPTLAWLWVDSTPLHELQRNLLARFENLSKYGRAGMQAATTVESAEAAMWFSRFWMAGGAWLDSRVTPSGKRRPPLMGKVTTALPRQQARQIARQHGLDALPTVEVVYLRRAEPREAEAGGEHRHRDYQYCWLMEPFPRRQWFPSLGRHQLIMVSEHIRGPRDRPLKHARRVYAVNR